MKRYFVIFIVIIVILISGCNNADLGGNINSDKKESTAKANSIVETDVTNSTLKNIEDESLTNTHTDETNETESNSSITTLANNIDASNQADIYGSHSGNISNRGFVAENDENIFYMYTPEITYYGEGSLYKADKNGNGISMVCSDAVIDINVIGDWIYYSNYADHIRHPYGGKIYKIRTDGTERTKLNDVDSAYLNIANGWIYYINLSDGDFMTNQRIYKMRLDGTCNTKLNDEMCSHLNVVNDWIYYLSWVLNEEENIFKPQIYKMKIDGTQRSKISDDYDYTDFMCTDGKLILYNNLSDGGKMYSIMADDNTQKTKLTDEGVEFINIWGEWIYYVSKDRTLNRVLTDGTNKSVLWEQRSFKLNIIDGWIYFDKGCGEYMERHKMKLDGTMEGAIRGTSN